MLPKTDLTDKRLVLAVVGGALLTGIDALTATPVASLASAVAFLALVFGGGQVWQGLTRRQVQK